MHDFFLVMYFDTIHFIPQETVDNNVGPYWFLGPKTLMSQLIQANNPLIELPKSTQFKVCYSKVPSLKFVIQNFQT